MANQTIDIVVADKSPLIQGGLANIIDQDDRFTLIATASDCDRFLEAVRRM